MEDPTAASRSSASDQVQRGLFVEIMRRWVVHIIALFLLVYVGLEVTVGGWIVTYIISERGGGPSSGARYILSHMNSAYSSTGYISSGFFGGLFLGRVALLWVNHKVGARRVIFIYAALVLAWVFVAPLSYIQ
jgi:fucose permease